MALSIPKINLGFGSKKSHFDKTHDVNTTSDFGFCQPTIFEPVIPHSTIKLKTNSFCRLLPMPCPSFSRVNLVTNNVFVPISDVYLAYDALQAQQPVTSYNKTYIPSIADNISANQLYAFLFKELVCLNFGGQQTVESSFVNCSSPFIPVLWGFDKNEDLEYISMKPTYTYLKNQTQPAQYAEFTESDISQICNLFLERCGEWQHFGTEVAFKRSLILGTKVAERRNKGLSVDGLNYLAFSIENADYWMDLGDFLTGQSNRHYVLTFHATHYGKRMLKVLRTLKYDFLNMDFSYPLYPMLAYYKGWYDLYCPQRTTTWKSTPAYKIIHGYYDNNQPMEDIINIQGVGTPTEQENAMFIAFVNLLVSLPNCCYTLDVDPFTVCTNQPYPNEFGNDTSYPEFPLYENYTDSATSNPFVGATVSEDDMSGSIGLRWLQKLLPMVSKNSVIGRRIQTYMSVHGLGGHEEERHFNFGGDTSRLQITDLYNVADTAPSGSHSNLGEFAGRGEGSNSGNVHTFETKEYGFLIQYLCVVPLGGYSQSSGSHPLSRYQFYQKEFDSLGMEAVAEHQIMNDSDNLRHEAANSTFGFRPRFMEYKFKTNLRNGGFAFRSERDQLLPYCLDRYFTPGNLIVTPETVTPSTGDPYTVYKLKETDAVVIPNHESLRFIGLNENYGNYDRLFYDNQGTTDNFIVHLIQELHVYSPMLPISDSFDTFDALGLNDDTSKMSISHV